MKVSLGLRVAVVVALVAIVAPSVQAGIIASNGVATLTHTASFNGGPAVVDAVAGGIGPAPNPLVLNSVINGVGGDNSTATGGVDQTFNWAGPDSHLVFLPAGFDIWVDDTNGSLDAFGLGVPSATFRLDFDVDFFLDNGLGGVNTFVNFPFVGNAPAGYQVDFSVVGTWSGAPIPNLTLSDAASFTGVGAFAGALVDNGVWGGYVDVGGNFKLAGFLELSISKAIGAAPAAIQLGMIDQVAIDNGLVPEPSTLVFALLGGVGFVTRRQRK